MALLPVTLISVSLCEETGLGCSCAQSIWLLSLALSLPPAGLPKEKAMLAWSEWSKCWAVTTDLQHGPGRGTAGEGHGSGRGTAGEGHCR